MDTQSIGDVVKQITDLIVMEAHPEAVYLFGSQVKGNITDDSDIDILVIQKDVKNPINMDLDRKANALTNRLVDIKFIDPRVIDSYPAYKSVFLSGRKLF